MTTSVEDRPAVNDPSAYAAAQAKLFCGVNLHVGQSRIVHAVAWVDWINGLVLPAPACRQAFSGHGVHAELRPDAGAVSCRRCLRLAGQRTDSPCDLLRLF